MAAAEKRLPSSRLKVGKPRVTFQHIRRHPAVPEDEIWVEVRLDDAWVAAYRLDAQAGQHVIAEVRLSPYEEDARPGESSGPVPPGGLPWDKVRALRTDHVLQAVQEFVEERDDQTFVRRVLERFELEPVLVSDVVPRRRRRSDKDVAEAARVYAEAPRGHRGQAVADAIDRSQSNANKVISQARDRGFLAGDQLTDRAREVLSD